MKVTVAIFAAAASLSALASAQAAALGQCGASYPRPTTSVAGDTSTEMQDYQPQPSPSTGAAPSKTQDYQLQPTPSTSAAPSKTQDDQPQPTPSTSVAPTKTQDHQPQPTPSSGAATCAEATKFKYFGVNQAGAEFGSNNVPGELGTHYVWPATSSIDYFLGIGMNTFRIPFLMERLSPPAYGLAGPMDATYLAALKKIATYVTGKGGHAIIDPHNYGRYNGAIITDTAAFGTWWKNLASEFQHDSNIIFDTNNEYHDMDQKLVFDLNQASINGIRAAGATSQLILVEGNAWTGAWSWISSGNAESMIHLEDPNDNIAFEMHQYLDSGSSGTSETCESSTVGAEKLAAATKWLQQNGKKGFLGETGGGSNDACIAAVQGALCHMQQAGGVWIGALWWAAGPMWGSYFQSIEPPNGISISRILPEALMPFV